MTFQMACAPQLYTRNISVPSGLSHEELFNYLLIQESSTNAQEFNLSSDNSNSAPPKGNIPSNRSKQSELGPSAEASILSSLLEVKSALNVMNTRKHSLENNKISSACNLNNPGPSSSIFETAQAAPLPADITPQWILGTAVPAPTMGSWFLRTAAIPSGIKF